MKKFLINYLICLSLALSILICSCGFDEGWVGRENSKALREAKKYWEIKNETVVPLEEIPIETGVKVIYSTDGINFKTVEVHHQNKGLKFYTLNYPDKEAKIRARYNAMVESYKVNKKI